MICDANNPSASQARHLPLHKGGFKESITIKKVVVYKANYF